MRGSGVVPSEAEGRHGKAPPAALRRRAAALLVPLALAALGAPPAAGAQGLPAEDVALLLSGQAGGPLRLEARALPWETTAGGIAVRVVAEVAITQLIAHLPVPPPAAGASPLTLRWAIYAVADSGSVVASRVRTVSADPERLAATGAQGVRLLETLELPPGALSVRVLARIAGTPRFGLRVLPLDLAAGPPALSAFAAGESGEWIELADLARASPAPATESLAALAVGRAGETLRVLVRSPGEADLATWLLTPSAGDGDPREVTAVAAAAVGGERAVEIALPPGIEGRFRLRPRGTAEGSAFPVLVLGPSGSSATGEQATAVAGWPATLAPATGRPRPAAAGRGEPARQGKLRQRAARRALLDALSALARRDDPAAGPEPQLAAGAEALAATFATAWATAGPAGIATVLAEGSRLGEELATVTPGALPPVIAAAEAAHRRCLARQENGCASGAQRLAGSLLELYAARAGDAAPFAASAWTALGWQMLQSYLFGSAERSLRRAIELDPRQAAAHLTLAILYERMADYEAAADVLDRALAAQPDLPEARLRRAVQWARLRRSGDAARELADLASGPAPTWVRVVAFEELATLERQTSGADAATATLRRALAAFPREEQLRIQLAAVLEAAGGTGEAARLLGELGEPAASGSPRNRYGDWPTEELERVRASFRARAADGVPDLGRALAATTR